MTTVLLLGDTVYADSRAYTGTHQVESLCKINPLPIPFQLVCTLEGLTINDMVYGWSGTGTFVAQQKMAEHFARDTKLDGNVHVSINDYQAFAASDVLELFNTFEVVFIGDKFNHSFRLEARDFTYRQIRKDEVLAMGTGRDHVLREMQSHLDPIRAMLMTYHIDEMSGGMTDCWKIVTNNRALEEGETEQDLKSFQRHGICNAMNKQHIPWFIEMWVTKKGEEKMGFDLLGVDEATRRGGNIVIKKLLETTTDPKLIALLSGNIGVTRKRAVKRSKNTATTKAMEPAAKKSPVKRRTTGVKA